MKYFVISYLCGVQEKGYFPSYADAEDFADSYSDSYGEYLIDEYDSLIEYENNVYFSFRD